MPETKQAPNSNPPAATPKKNDEPITSPAIVDDTSFDFGTRYRPSRLVSPTQHLGGMPTVILDNGSELLDERLPEIDPDKAVIPTVNVPLEVLVQKMVDKALSEKDKSELTRSEVFPGTVTMTPEEAEASAKADAEATEAAAKDQNEVKNP